MYIIFLLMVISIITAITLLKEADRKKKLHVKTFHITELDYLYLYKSILLRMSRMENEMAELENTVDGYHNNTKTADLTFEPCNLKEELNEINIKLKRLIENYALGEISLSNISFELDVLDKRLNTVSHLIAA